MQNKRTKPHAIPPARSLDRSELGPGLEVVLDATPLIRLSQAGLLPHLESAFHPATGRMLIITESVWFEGITPGKPGYAVLRHWFRERTQRLGIFPVWTFLDQLRHEQHDKNPDVNHRMRGDGENASLEMLEDTSFPNALFVCDDTRGRNEAKRRHRRVMGVRSFAHVLDFIDKTANASAAIERLAIELLASNENIKVWTNDSPLT